VVYYTRWWYWTFTGLFLMAPGRHAEVSVNLPLDDPAYSLLDKLVTSNLTFTNALTVKPITRLYAARLIAEAVEQRRHEIDTAQRQEPFLTRYSSISRVTLNAHCRRLASSTDRGALKLSSLPP
jgi:hypothetical protein